MVNQKIIFTKEECEEIIKINKSEYHDWSHLKVRDYVSESIKFNDLTKWIFDRLLGLFVESTNKEIKKINKTIHFHTYRTNSLFEKHSDSIYGRLYVVGTLLNDSFEGGEFIVYDKEETIINKEIGNTYCFESRLFHEVKPIKNGVRNSIIYFIREEDLYHKVNRLL